MNGANAKFSDATLRSTSWIGRFKTELRADKKRTTILVVLLVIIGIIIGRLVVSYDPPVKASGETGDANLFLPHQSSDTCRQYRLSGKNRLASPISIDRNITRDLFWPDTRYFPLPEQTGTNNGASGPKEADYAQKLAESKQRERLKQAEHIKSIHTKAKALFLTTIMLGRSPTALINGQVLRTGDLINGFRLKSISSDCCVVVMEGVNVKLQMPE